MIADSFEANFKPVYSNNSTDNKFANSLGINMPHVVMSLVSEEEIAVAIRK